MTWTIRISDEAKRQLNKIKDTPKYLLFEKAILDLAQSNDPAALGTFKHRSGLRCYAYNVSKSFRLLYSVDYDAHIIRLHAAGDHKQVYGKD